jgi:hypothetical protein
LRDKLARREHLVFTLRFWHSRCNIDETYMRLLKGLLTLGGAACIGWAVPNLAASILPFYGVNDFATIGLNSLVLAVGITFLVMGMVFIDAPYLLGCLAVLFTPFWLAISFGVS